MDTPLARLFQACDPMKPATAQQYIDCSDVRGGHPFTERFMGALRNAGEKGGHMRYILTGHVGGGKSSELVHLSQELARGDALADNRRYLPVLFDAREFIEDYDATPDDILLAIIAELAETLKAKIGVELRDGYIKRKVNEFIRFLNRDVDVEELEVPLSDTKAKIKLLKRDPSARELVRNALGGSETTFLEELNSLFDEARIEVRRHDYSDIVLILDNLERIVKVKGSEPGLKSHESLFITNATKFTDLACTFVLTVPLPLIRTHPGELRAAYGEHPFSLPMIKVRTRAGDAYEPGILKMRELLKLRGADDTVITDEAENLLIRFSGGHVRDLLGTVREAISLAGNGPVELRHARSALGQIVNTLNVSASGWDRLARLELDPDRKLDPKDPECAYLLAQLFVLEYINGGEDDEFLQHDETWYAAAPLLQGMRSFKSATKRIIDGQKSS